MRRLGFVRFSLSVISLAVLVAAMHVPATAQTGVNVTTWHNDNWRTGQNTSETTLTTGINQYNFGKLCSYSLPNEQVYAQPLVGSAQVQDYACPRSWMAMSSWQAACRATSQAVRAVLAIRRIFRLVRDS